MSFLDIAGGLATAAGRGIQGYALDQQTRAADLLAKQKADDEARRNAVLNFVALQGVDPDVQGRLAKARADAGVGAAIDTAKGLAPIRTQEAVDTAKGLAPVHVQEAVDSAAGTAGITEGTHEKERLFDNAHQPADKPVISIQPSQDPSQPAKVVAVDPGDPMHPRVANVPGVGKGSAQGSAQGGGPMSGQTMQTMARMGMSRTDLAQTIAQMEKFENDPAFRAKLTQANKALMAGAEAQPNAEAHGLGGVVGNVLGQYASGAAQSHLDPELNTYLNLRQRVATAFTELLPRPNQQLLQIEKGLSGIDVGWNPQLLQGIQARRRAGMETLDRVLQGEGPGSAGTASHTAGSGDPDFDALMAKYKKP